MTTNSLSVACIGLGRMGSGIAHNIQKAGFRFTVYNRTPEKAKPFVDAGAALARTPREAAAAADIVVTNLMDDASVIATMMGEDGILAGMRPGAIHIGTTTISPSVSTRLAQLHAAQGSHYVAGPVAGRRWLRRRSFSPSWPANQPWWSGANRCSRPMRARSFPRAKTRPWP